MRLVVPMIVLCLAGSPSIAQDYSRGLANYRAVLSGTKKLRDLTQPEQMEVLAIARAVSRRTPTNASPQCRDARDEAEDARESLSSAARRLVSCAEDSDLTEDCSSEFSRARSAHSEFESAVSDVEDECD